MSKKNKITEQEVKKIAGLSRLSLTESELEKRTEDMNNILNYMDTLNEIDTEDVQELNNVHDMHTSLRADTANSSLSKEDVLNFMQTYQRISQNMFKYMPKYASIIINLGSDHQIKSTVYKKK